ncbi:MAG: MFS transporter [Elusimicrobiales bacterium]|nr:MFS transporter [Elusimicrobiales bacterium]
MKKFINSYYLGYKGFHPDARRFLVLSFLQSFAGNIFGLVFNLYVLKLGYTRDFLGTLGAIPGLTIAALSIPLAVFCAGFSARRSILTAMGLSLAATAGLSLATGRAPLMLFSVVSGSAGALMAITSLPLMASLTTAADRQKLFSAQYASSMIAAFLGNLASGWLTALWAFSLCGGEETALAYRLTLLTAFVLLAATVPFALRLKADRNLSGGGGAAAFTGMNLGYALLVLSPQLVVAFGAGMIIPYLNIFFKTGFDLPVSGLGYCMALMQLAMAAGAMVGPFAVARLGRVRALITFQALSIPFLATMGFSGFLLPTLLAAFARTMLMNAGWPIYSVFMLDHFPAGQHQAISALYTTAWNLTNSAGAKLSGRLQMDFGFTLPFLITITCYCAATLLLSRKFLKEDSKKAVIPTALKEELE